MKTVKLANDSFIHFTLEARVREIIEDGRLRVHPPHRKFGIAGVQAVSVNHGYLVPGVQFTHLKPSEEEGGIAAIHFKTNTMPRIGYPEEVIWDHDVNLISPRAISLKKAIDILRPQSRSIGGTQKEDDEDDEFIYETVLSSLTTRIKD